MGKLPGKLKRTFWDGFPESMVWELINPDGSTEANYKFLESLAYKEAVTLKRKKIINFHEDDFNVSILNSIGGQQDFQAEVKLRSYDPNKLFKELRKLKFKVAK